MESFAAIGGRRVHSLRWSLLGAIERKRSQKDREKEEGRLKREIDARVSIRAQDIQPGDRVSLRKKEANASSRLVEGIVDRFGMHTSNVGGPHIRSIIVEDGNGNVHSIRLRGILYIHKR